jgi:hypothetical protein
MTDEDEEEPADEDPDGTSRRHMFPAFEGDRIVPGVFYDIAQ